MKISNLVLFVSVLSGVISIAADKPKMAHMHVAKHGGNVQMLGDVHFEAIGDSKMLMIYSYDRYGDNLPASKIKVKLVLVEGSKKRDLSFTKDKKESNLIHVMMPADVDAKIAQVELKAKNVNLPKGQNVGAYLVKIELNKLGAKDAEDLHAEHKM